MDIQGCPIRELGHAAPLFSKKVEEPATTARAGSERAFRFDRNRIALRRRLSIELGSSANSIVTNAGFRLGILGEGLPNGAFSDALKMVGRHFDRDKAEQGQHRKPEEKASGQSDERVQVSHSRASLSLGRGPTSLSLGRGGC